MLDMHSNEQQILVQGQFLTRREFSKGLNLFGDENFLRGQIPNGHHWRENNSFNTGSGKDLNLPCQRNPPWNYETMCSDVGNDGTLQPCRYAAIVDLEDFM